MANTSIYQLNPNRVANNDIAFECTALAWDEDLAVIDNHTVFALAGNANNENLQARIVEVKGEKRGTKQPVGWTRPFNERMLDTIDVNQIDHDRMREMLRNPDDLTAYLGGLTFIRAQADQAAKLKHDIPDCIIPPNTSDAAPAAVQIYSPAGITTTTHVTELALARGAETVMTSANRSTQPESTTPSHALEFVNAVETEKRPIETVLICTAESVRAERPRGSYPVIIAEKEGFVVKRLGCFEPSIFQRILHEYPVAIDPQADKPKYPGNVLRMQDMPELAQLKGTELRLGLLAHLGWSNELATD